MEIRREQYETEILLCFQSQGFLYATNTIVQILQDIILANQLYDIIERNNFISEAEFLKDVNVGSHEQ